MGMMDKFRNFMGMPDDNDYDEEYDYENDGEMDHATHKRTKESPVAENPYAGEHDSEFVKRSNKVVNIAATTQLSVVLVKPERFDDASPIADHLNAKRTVVLNLESTNKDVSRRLVDFLSGVAYANQGQIKRVANSTFIITPYNVDFVGDLLDELENSGVYF